MAQARIDIRMKLYHQINSSSCICNNKSDVSARSHGKLHLYEEQSQAWQMIETECNHNGEE